MLIHVIHVIHVITRHRRIPTCFPVNVVLIFFLLPPPTSSESSSPTRSCWEEICFVCFRKWKHEEIKNLFVGRHPLKAQVQGHDRLVSRIMSLQNQNQIYFNCLRDRNIPVPCQRFGAQHFFPPDYASPPFQGYWGDLLHLCPGRSDPLFSPGCAPSDPPPSQGPSDPSLSPRFCASPLSPECPRLSGEWTWKKNINRIHINRPTTSVPCNC